MATKNEIGLSPKNTLKKKLNTEQKLQHVFRGVIPGEAAIALDLALKKLGWPHSETITMRRGMFGQLEEHPFERHSITRSDGSEVEIPYGTYTVDNFGTIGADISRDEIPLFVLNAAIPAKATKERWEQLLAAVREEVKGLKIFREQALKIEKPRDLLIPNFINVKGEATLIFNKPVMRQLETALFNPIKYRERFKSAKIRTKRGILLEGSYGVGKTLTAYATAKMAIDNGWTFITADSNISQLAYQIAALVQPTVLFIEDVDADAHGDRDGLNEFLNAISSVEVKTGVDIIMIVSTNFSERIDPAFMRPERIDAIVEIKRPDTETRLRLIKHFGGGFLDLNADFTKVVRELENATPAIIMEAVERAKMQAIVDGTFISAADLEYYIDQMKRQRDLADPKLVEDSLGDRLVRTTREVVRG